MAVEARVRSGQAADLKAMAAIEQRAAINPWSLSQFLGSRLSDDTDSLVLESQDGEVLGFALLQRVLDEATLLNIAVNPDQQGGGLGGQLLSASLDKLRAGGIRRVLLEVRRGNDKAISLYRRFGFVDDGVRRDYYPSATGREDALLMSCKLEQNQ